MFSFNIYNFSSFLYGYSNMIKYNKYKITRKRKLNLENGTKTKHCLFFFFIIVILQRN